MALLWHRFGLAVSIAGEVKECDLAEHLFCLRIDARRDQWCRLRSENRRLPDVGGRIEAFGWEKWNTRILDILDVKPMAKSSGA